jgi:HEAT repeat protein
MIAPSEFQRYLQSVLDTSREDTKREVSDRYIPTLAELPLRVQTAISSEPDSQEQQEERREQFAVLEGLRKYATDHVLLVGKPGSGKSTSLRRLLWEEARHCLEAIEEGKSEIPPIPILIELRGLSSSVLAAIQEKLKWWLYLDETTLIAFLRDRRLFVFLDGLNELPNEQAWQAVDDFRQVCVDLKVSLIITTRELGSGLVQGNVKKLEMLPLTEPQMEEFVYKQLPETGGELWRQIQGKLRELAETPLLLKMLCDVFEQKGEIPKSRGDLFRKEFARRYEEFKPERLRNVSKDSRRFAFDLLTYLAFRMVQGEPHIDSSKPSASWIAIPKTEAEKILATFLAGDRTPTLDDTTKAKEWLEDLVEWHLLQIASDPTQIEFHHQLFQEYYAAEWLAPQLAELSDEELQYYYLNYLKWTEPLAMAMSFVESEPLAVRMVKLALEVDLNLGARLAGAVKPEPNIQQKTVSMIASQRVPEWFRISLLGETKSPQAANELIKTIQSPDPAIRNNSVFALRQLNSEVAMPLIVIAIEDSDPNVRKTAIRVIGLLDIKDKEAIPLITQILTKEPIASLREAAVIFVLSKLDSEAAILALLMATQDTNNNVSEIAREYLKEKNSEIVITVLIRASENIEEFIRISAIQLLGELGDGNIIPVLWRANLDLNTDVHNAACEALNKVRNRAKAKRSGVTERQEAQRQDQINVNNWRGYLNSEDPILRGNAIYHLAMFLDKEEVIPLIKKALDDPHPYVRGHAITDLLRLMGNEAIPQAIRALDDPNYHVRDNAAQALAGLRPNQPEKLEIPEETVSKLIEILNKDQDTNEDEDISVRRVTINTLTNLCSIQPSLVLREDLESVFLNASSSSDNPLRSKAAGGLGKFSSDRVSIRLLEMVGDSDFLVALSATEALKNMPYNIIMAQHLPALIELIYTSEKTFALEAIAGIQSRCGFYNYEIYQQAQEADNLGFEDDLIRNLYKDIDKVISKIQENPELRQEDKEDRLTIDIVNQLSLLGYDVSHDTKIGGHVDIVVRKNEFLWLGEAKIYKDNNYLWEGFLQLVTRYSTGDYNQENGGLLIYIRHKNASSIMQKWQNYLITKSLPDFSLRPCKMRSLAFISTHKHERSGQAFHVRHIPVMLHFAPTDKSGRARNTSP